MQDSFSFLSTCGGIKKVERKQPIVQFSDEKHYRVVDMGSKQPDELLPKMDIDSEPGFIIPGYDFQAAVTPPAAIGVRREGSMGAVIDGVRGVAYYTDVIGFGQASNDFTRALPADKQPYPIGINYFLKTNVKCPNGEYMYRYIRGITQGNAFGDYVKQSLADVGLPGLRGLAPGMMEDVKEGLNPADIFRAAFGDAYPDCVYAELPVGDYKGNIKNPDFMKDGQLKTGETYITGTTFMKNGRPHQGRWIQKEDDRGNPIFLSKAEYEKAASASAQSKETYADYMGVDDEERLRLYTRAFGASLICAGALYYFTK